VWGLVFALVLFRNEEVPMITDLQRLNARRLEHWGQTPETRAIDEDASAR
jgi:hypothetical protein